MRRRPPHTPLLCLIAWLACACGADGPPVIDGFEDHTVPTLQHREDFFAHAETAGSLSAVKFTITEFADPGARALVFYHSAFYELHDEWYWFRLLNDQPVPGATAVPVSGLSFDSVAAIYAWAEERPTLPLDLRFVDDGSARLYSPQFYRQSLAERPRTFGLGSLLYAPAVEGSSARGERWAFQLEYSDEPSYEQLVVFFEALRHTLPPEIAEAVAWVVRSPAQEQLARRMEREALPYADRVLRFSQLSVPGEVEVYNPGLVAGRVRLVEQDGQLATTRNDEIVVLQMVPDELPAASALISAVPQTPLAHLNLLARNRGIPNLYLGDALAHPELRQLGNVRAPAIIQAALPDQLRIATISAAELYTWQQLRQLPTATVPQVELAQAPLVLDLAQLGLAEVEALRPLIGGKAAGFLALQAAEGLTMPETPAAITIRPYVEHLAELRPVIAQMLATFQATGDVRLRYLVLEGRQDYDQRFASATDKQLADRFVAERPAPDPLGELVRNGGLKRVLRDKPIDATTLAAIRDQLQQQFSALSPLQGLRFRSSSTVEDIEGFNGAGLYDSNTGFFEPTIQPAEKDRTRSLAWAIKKTWASYWSFEAFEERQRERIDHLSGAMAVLVHPRFDDSHERANGVLTFTQWPPGYPQAATMALNVQQGAVSVTNPDSSALPEEDHLTLQPDGTLGIERRRCSSLVPDGTTILDEAQLRTLFDQAQAVTDAWLAQQNRGVGQVQQARGVVLDFEFRWMAAGWPALASGAVTPSRLVIKQVRSLEPGRRHLAAAARSLPLPAEILARARRIEQRRCSADRLTLTVIEAFTDASRAPDLGYDQTPFTALVQISFTEDIPALDRRAGETLSLYHPSFTAVDHPAAAGAPWQLSLQHSPQRADDITGLTFASGAGYRLEQGASVLEGVAGPCAVELLHSSPADYLLHLLAARQEDAPR